MRGCIEINTRPCGSAPGTQPSGRSSIAAEWTAGTTANSPSQLAADSTRSQPRPPLPHRLRRHRSVAAGDAVLASVRGTPPRPPQSTRGLRPTPRRALPETHEARLPRAATPRRRHRPPPPRPAPPSPAPHASRAARPCSALRSAASTAPPAARRTPPCVPPPAAATRLPLPPRPPLPPPLPPARRAPRPPQPRSPRAAPSCRRQQRSRRHRARAGQACAAQAAERRTQRRARATPAPAAAPSRPSGPPAALRFHPQPPAPAPAPAPSAQRLPASAPTAPARLRRPAGVQGAALRAPCCRCCPTVPPATQPLPPLPP
eukprot:Rhum_TRINITY_DN10518_c1_g2::Rhum_TRINITY_DN10518_c1_g2_i1::g.38853::m.38853